MKKLLAFVFLISLITRIWFAIGYWGNKPLTHDATEYLELAKNFNQTGRLELPARKTLMIESYGRAPGYPIWLAFLLRISPTLSWIRIAEALIGILNTYLFFLLARELFGLRTGIVAFVISSFYVPFIVLAPVILSENLWMCCMLISYWFLIRKGTVLVSSKIINHILSFVVLAIATFIRPGTVFLLPFYLLFVFRKRDLSSTIVLFALYFLILLPWNLHLYRKEGHLIFVASEGGITLWTGTHPSYSGDGDLSVNPGVQRDYRELLKKYSGLTSAERGQTYTRLAFENILKHPAQFAMIEIKKLAFWILPIGPSVTKMSILHIVSSFLFYIPLLIFAVLGYRRLGPDFRFFVIGIGISFTFMILVFIPQERFRIASLDPVLLVVASNELMSRFFSPKRQGDPARDAIMGV
ncbi:glycosyltransferase family 39 protein [bacterium]|nr:glycosyltransferase family 39 protein [bacterium]